MVELQKLHMSLRKKMGENGIFWGKFLAKKIQKGNLTEELDGMWTNVRQGSNAFR